MAKFDEFIAALQDCTDVEELMGGPRPDSEEEAIASYVEAAKKLGFDLSAEEIVEGFKAMKRERVARTEQAEREASELPVDTLDAVAGGGVHGQDPPDYKCTANYTRYDCQFSFINQENCWRDDGCDQAYRDYLLYECKYSEAGAGCEAFFL